MRRSTRFFAFSVLLVPTAVAACGGSADGDPVTVPPGTVLLRPASFEPETIEVGVGEEVTWRWQEKVSHNIVGKGGIDKKVADSGTYSRAFEEKGTYDYRCTIHPGMTGSIVVE